MCYMKVENKLEKLQELLHEFNLKNEEILYMGDDIPDLEVMQYCGLPVAPQMQFLKLKIFQNIFHQLKVAKVA